MGNMVYEKEIHLLRKDPWSRWDSGFSPDLAMTLSRLPKSPGVCFHTLRMNRLDR